MGIQAARNLILNVASTHAPDDKEALQHVFLRRFVLRMQDEPVRSYAEHPWQMQSAITKQSSLIEAEIAFTQDAATRIVRDAALQAHSFVVQVIFPDDVHIEGMFNITDYEVFAESGDVLRIAFTAHSRDALLLHVT